MSRRSLNWLALLLLGLPALAVLWIAIFGWNWARGPLQRFTSERTGRELIIGGDLKVSLGWPAPRIHAQAVTFANPSWAQEKQMIAVDDVEFTVDLLKLLGRNLVFPEVRLTHPVVFLERAADGRRTWLLDREQSDETARIPIGRLTLDRGQLGYDDARQKTRIRSEISTQAAQAGGVAATGVVFVAKGLYKGLALAARGSGASVLALHDESVPYPLNVDATVGHTGIKADGTVTSLLKVTAMDMHLALRGDSLAQLFPLFGITFPETPSYTTGGHIVHSGQNWRYENFSGHIGKSDIAGTLQVETGGARPFMHGDLVSQRLDLDDLGPLVGAKAQLPATAGPHWLPDIPFEAERWKSVDADVTLRAGTISRARQSPFENLTAHLTMKDSVLTLQPVDFGVAGGHLKAVISLDGRQDPIQARAKIGARRILLAKLFPTVKLASTSIGQINGEFDLAGRGNSVGRMLAASDGRIGLIVANGEISTLLLQEIGLHLLEILHLKITGDKTVRLHCAVADFGVRSGVMQINSLVLDTDVSTITGTGSIDLGRETLDLTLVPTTKSTSLVALRSPIYVRGTFSDPVVEIDKARILARGAGALALGLINPLLALLPLVELGPGIESDCDRLIQEAKGHSANAPKSSASGSAK